MLELLAALGLMTAALAVPAGTASASTSLTVASCPTVDATTGAVTPGPSPGIDWSGCNLANADLSGADLAHADLSGAYITGQSRQDDLSKANLSGADLSAAALNGTTLAGADLSGATFTSADLSGAVLTGVTLTATTDFSQAILEDVSSGSVSGTTSLLPADWSLAQGYLIGPYAILSNASLQSATLTGAHLANATLDGAQLQNADLSGADMTGATLNGAQLQNADLSGATMTGVYLPSANLAGSNLSGTDLADANLSQVSSGSITATSAPTLPTSYSLVSGYLIGPYVNLTGANLAGAGLPTADLILATLVGADLANADLTSANLTSADLQGADLSGANLSTATLTMVRSGTGGITATSTPSLPAGWMVGDGYLIGPRANLTSANLAGTTDLSTADLYGADLNSADLSSADLSGADLSYSSLYKTNLTSAVLTNADLSGAYMYDTNLSGTNLGSAILTLLRTYSVYASASTQPKLPPNWMLIDGYLIGPGAQANDDDLSQADLSGADLSGANLSDANLSSANLSGANLSGTDLSYANLSSANLAQATVTGADFTGAHWAATTCPDGTNSDKYVDGCFSALDTSPPVAAVAVSGTSGANGWYVSPVTVTWNWSDDATINTSQCNETSSTTGNGSFTLTASCTDLAGNTATRSLQVKVDTTTPAAAVTGVRSGARYVYGHVPAAGCQTTDSVSGVAKPATVTVTTTGSHGVGRFTATCAGAISKAGTGQAAPVSVHYTVVYGFSGFITPKPGSSVARSAGRIVVRFRLTNAAGHPIPAWIARALASAHHVRVVLSGPSISRVRVLCRWYATPKLFHCVIPIPAGVRIGRTHRYHITAFENVGFGFVRAPAVGGAVNPETIHFKRT